ncbi:inorganic pyrophosphatase [Mycena rosella]|uniref:inorganic diphosphatase n=1 Tax=Mycena rosella TaxID=1033263 RepID=A0AAD7GC29_MYCRO|nr:inorganic pyrophosphatase [Mycena rosella]
MASLSTDSSSSYTWRSVGAPNTPEHSIFVLYNGHVLSALHDVPLLPAPTSSSADLVPKEGNAELTLNMVVEAPRWTSATMMLMPSEAFAPIRQKRRGRRLAYVRNCFPHQGYIWNYGALPQTWADGAPLRVCELGERVAQTGDVRSVRVLGLLAPRDEGVLRWTLLVLDTADPLAARVNNIADLERECPGLISATREWFRLYKLPDGKDENTLDFDGEVKGPDFAAEIVRTAHEAWRNVVTASTSTSTAFVDITNVTIRNSPGLVRGEDVESPRGNRDAEQKPPAPMSSSASKWWYIGSRVA